MNEINWNQFMLKNANPQEAFETICRNLFLREYKVSSHEFSANYNQTGLEIEPIFFEEKYYGFQCKYSTSGNSDSFYAQVFDSLSKAVVAYPNLNKVIIYTNLNIKPNVSPVDLVKPKKSNRVKINELMKKHNVEIIWFVKTNFEKALNEVENYDLYRSFFSSQDTRGLLSDFLTHEDRTFLNSNQFIELALNGIRFSDLKEEIISKDISIITGAAGTGKSEILKKLYLESETKYLLNINQVPSNTDIAIPIFIRLRECINGNLEDLLRNRLKDFDVNVTNSRNQYSYFFDGLDEISAIDFEGVVTCLMRLRSKPTTQTLVLTSRTNTSNLTTVLRDFRPEVYGIDALVSGDVDAYFERITAQEKYIKYMELKNSNLLFLKDITDIFSVVLLCKNLFQIDHTTTKVDLIRLNAKKMIESNRKYSLINLPEPKSLYVEKILALVSESMQRSGNISVSRLDLQEIIKTLFPSCNYLQIDEIIDYVAEMFFDASGLQSLQKRYAYRHKRYFEYFLYCAIKNLFYENPGILRELRLLPNKDFILNIFLVQELKNNTISGNLQNVLTLRFFEAYLGEDYLRGAQSPWFMSKSLIVPSSDSYLQSKQLQEYLCTKQFEDLKEFLRSDPLSIKGFLNVESYYTFIKQYHISSGVDIRAFLDEIYDIQDEWLEEAAQRNRRAFLYCKCVIDQGRIEDVYDAINAIESVSTVDLDYYPYNGDNVNIIVDFYELAVEFFSDWVLSNINNISKVHFEVLSYVLLRSQNLRYLLNGNDGLTELMVAFSNRISTNDVEQYGIHTITLYSVLTGNVLQKEDIQERARKANINHYETWRRNFELNNYVGMVLGEEFRAYHYDYKLGIALRRILNEYYPNKKEEVLLAFLQEVKKYNLVYRNWFSYNNAVFIGECLSVLDVNSSDVKKFVIDIRKCGSVVSAFQILYIVMRRNPELFRIIANPTLITAEYDKACQELSYYDYNSDLGFMYATMISHFDIVKADALFEQGINNSVFRPIFRKENMIDYYLPNCLLTAYNNYWLPSEELEVLFWRVAEILRIAKDTLDSGAYDEYFKYVIGVCCPHLLNQISDLSGSAENRERLMGWENYSSQVPRDELTIENLSECYTCRWEGINYSSVSVWKEIIGFELENDSELTILYRTLEENYFPSLDFGKMGQCFYIITAVLISNAKTKPKAVDFIMRHAGRMGIVNLLKATALIGDDKLGQQCIEQLMKLCEAMVYPSTKYLRKVELHRNQLAEIMDIICNSKDIDWDEDSEKNIMYYVPDIKISIRWDAYEEQEPFNEEWAIRHPDSNAHSTKYSVYYQERLIKSFNMVWVDGYRALIPMPDYTDKHIDRDAYRLACLVNSNVETLNHYIIASGLTVD